MPSALDLRMDAVLARLTGPGGPLQVGALERDGRMLPAVMTAPPTLPAYFAHFCAQHGPATFLVSGTERFSFAEVHALATRVARGMVEGGVQPGERVGIAMRNSPAWILLYMGVLMAGGVATLLNGWWLDEELADAVRGVGCGLVYADATRSERLGSSGARVVAIDYRLPLTQALAPVMRDGGNLPDVGALDPATILFTSGSTGRAKGALSDHRAVVQGVFNYLGQALTMRTLAAEDGTLADWQPATLLTVPLFHVTAEVPVLLQSFAIGRKLVLMPRWDAEEAMRLIAAERVTYFVGVPSMSLEMLTHPRRGEYDLSSVTDFASGGAPRPADHVRRIAAEMGPPLIGYGLTETNAVGAGNWRTNYLAKPTSTGRPTPPLVQLAIVDDAGEPLPQGATGEVAIRSIANFLGYWGLPDDTATAMTADGFFRTGDLGRMDEDGYLFIVDRLKDIVIRGGENVSCQEVEDAIFRHPGVVECAVFGLPDERLGEVPGAVVRADGDVEPDALRTFLGRHIAAFKVPAQVWIVAEPLPRLATEKVDKVTLRARYRALWDAMRDLPSRPPDA